MTKFILLVFLAHPNGTVTLNASFYTGADLCLSQRDAMIEGLEKQFDAGTFSVQCVDSTLVSRLKEKPA